MLAAALMPFSPAAMLPPLRHYAALIIFVIRHAFLRRLRRFTIRRHYAAAAHTLTMLR